MIRYAVVLLLLTAGCARARVMSAQPEPIEPPGPNESKVVVFRDSFRNPLKPYAFFDDQELLGWSEPGAWFEVIVKPGRHFFYLHGVSGAGVRATLGGGRTYYLRADAEPDWFRLKLTLTPVVPGTEEFDRIDETLAGMKRKEPILSQLEAYVERRPDLIEAGLSKVRTEGIEETAVLSEQDGR